MEKVVLEGVEYVKASVVAKDFHYTSDYIGQLCRGKKVDARLVGRTWFVNPDSIKDHKKNRHQKSTSVPVSQLSKKSVGITKKDNVEQKSIAPVITNKAAKRIAEVALEREQSQTRKLMVWYESDQENLIPKLTKKVQPAKTIRIEHADAQKVKVTGKKRTPVAFLPSELPEVALSGKLTVTSFPDKTTDLTEEKPKNKAENKDISDNKEKDKKDDDTSKEKVLVQKTTCPPKEMTGIKPRQNPQSTSSAKPLKTEKRAQLLRKEEKTPSKVTQVVTPSAFTPVSVKKTADKLEQPVSLGVRLSPLFATCFALFCVLVIFSASSRVIVSESLYKSEVVLQTANLLEFIKNSNLHW